MRSGVRASLELEARWTAHGVRLDLHGDTFPVTVRRTGRDRAHLVGTGAWPLGGDEIDLRITVRAGARLALQAIAAMVALPGRDVAPSVVRIAVVVEEEASLWFDPGPTIVAGGADLHTTTDLAVAACGRVVTRELVLLGRHGEPGGTVTCRTDAASDGRVLVRETLRRPDPVTAPAVGLGRRGLASVLAIGPTAEAPGAGTPGSGPEGAGAEQHGPVDESVAGVRSAVLALPHGAGWRAIGLADDDVALTTWSEGLLHHRSATTPGGDAGTG